MAKEIAFAKRVKTEIATNSYDTEQKKYILSGFIRNGATFSLGKIPSLSLRTEIASVAKLLYACLKDAYSLEPTIHYEKVTRFGRGLVYLVTVEDPKLYEVMENLEVLKDGFERMTPSEGLHRKNFKYLCIGCFLANGSVNNPSSSKTSYFLEMAFTDKADAMSIKRKLLSFREEKTMSFKYIKRREKYVLYLKKSDQISVFLSFIGASEAMFEYENARILKDDMNITNRQANCDAANYSKSVKTAKKDIEDIDLVLSHTPINLFDEKAKAVILARKEKNELNYRELALYLTEEVGINITKSGVVHILTSIREKAEAYRREEKFSSEDKAEN